jgi:hypothetical protein
MSPLRLPPHINVRRILLPAALCALAILLLGITYQLGARHAEARLPTSPKPFELTLFQQRQLAREIAPDQESGRVEDAGGGWSRYTNPRSHFSMQFPNYVYLSGSTEPVPFAVYEDAYDYGRDVSVVGTRFDTAYYEIPRERLIGSSEPTTAGSIRVLREGWGAPVSAHSLTIHTADVPENARLLDRLKELFPGCPFTMLEQTEGSPGTVDLSLRTEWERPDDLDRIARTCKYQFYTGRTFIKYSPYWRLLVYANVTGGIFETSEDNVGVETKMLGSLRFE